MIKIVDKAKCCGCTSCSNVCPKQAIAMKPDEEGFLYPQVNSKLCIDCGLCDEVCPIKSGYEKFKSLEAFAARYKDETILRNSTSGGVYTALANIIINEGGIVYGAVYDKEFRVVHKRVSFPERDVSVFRGSKYVQSDLLKTFTEVKKDLKEGRKVLFSGTSCQIAGLNNFLKKQYVGLVTVEVICHGTPSPKLWKTYLDYQESKYKSKIAKVTFRNKTYGYHSGTMEIVFKNGKKYYGSNRVDYMLKSFFGEIASRPSCYECVCKGLERPADLSIYDCWHAAQLLHIKDDDKGYTNILVNTEEGRRLLKNSVGYLSLQAVDINQAIKLDGIMIEEYPYKHPYREIFYSELDKLGIKNTVSKLIGVTKKDYFIESSKGILYKMGLFKLIKKLSKG